MADYESVWVVMSSNCSILVDGIYSCFEKLIKINAVVHIPDMMSIHEYEPIS